MGNTNSMLRYLAELRSLPAAAAIAAGIFLIDTLTSLHFAVASLYVIVVLIAAHDLHRRGIVITGVTCAFLTVMSYVIMHGVVVDGAAPLRFAVSLISILIATILVLRNVTGTCASRKLRGLAQLLLAKNCRPTCRHSYSIFLRTPPTRHGSVWLHDRLYRVFVGKASGRCHQHAARSASLPERGGFLQSGIGRQISGGRTDGIFLARP